MLGTKEKLSSSVIRGNTITTTATTKTANNRSPLLL